MVGKDSIKGFGNVCMKEDLESNCTKISRMLPLCYELVKLLSKNCVKK